VSPRFFGGFNNEMPGNIWIAQCDIIFNGIGEEKYVLNYGCDGADRVFSLLDSKEYEEDTGSKHEGIDKGAVSYTHAGDMLLKKGIQVAYLGSYLLKSRLDSFFEDIGRQH